MVCVDTQQACVCFGNFSTLCSGRDSPTANEGGDDQDEAMPIPEDLSASTGLQNNRTDKPLGESEKPKLGHNHTTTSLQLPTAVRCNALSLTAAHSYTLARPDTQNAYSGY